MQKPGMHFEEKTARRSKHSAALAALLFIPLTAILHHAVFYRHTCILRYFGTDYTPAVLLHWLSTDPSAAIAALFTLFAVFIARDNLRIRNGILAFVVAFLPFSIWIWDIPFTSRFVCEHFHDGRSILRSRHFYAFGIAAFVGLLWAIEHRRNRREHASGAEVTSASP